MIQDELKNIAAHLLGSETGIDEDSEFIPLLSPEEEETMETSAVPEVLPILTLRNMVLFPGVVMPITVGRNKSVQLIKDAYKGDKIIGVATQKLDNTEDPGLEDVHPVGTVAQLLKTLKMPDGNTTVVIQGKKRFRIGECVQTLPYMKAKAMPISESKVPSGNKEFNALVASLKDLAVKIVQLSPNIPSEAGFALKNIESPSFLVNFISSNMNVPTSEKQRLLEILDLSERATQVLANLTKEVQMLELKNQIQNKVKVDMDKQQREFFLQQQMKQIQEELGDSTSQDVKELRDRAKQKKWSREVNTVVEKTIHKLEKTNPHSPDFGVLTNYLETILDLPWGEVSKDNFDLRNAQKVLDKDHFGMEKVKERILEHLAVLKLKGNMKSPILCLYGPPGVGKTSLGKSIAESLNRKYVRMSLGGLRDEAEIRGHRKTYIGAMPGRILQNMKKAGTSNPVFILDEIDKVGSDYHGDPSSALLEVLDPEQNNSFYDNYVEIEYDLSKVMFIATANSLSSIQPALRDRMEIIEITGYTIEEKIEIALRHLLPKQLEEQGLKKKQLNLGRDVVEEIIENYTRESGVRGLEKTISKVVRHAAKCIAMKQKFNREVKKEDLQKILGPSHAKDRYQGNDVAGVVTGLAWTSAGGDILFIETSITKGNGKLTLTGNLGDVMKESAIIALEYLKAHSTILGLNQEVFDKWNVHIHVPEGATPKDGPSAGVTLLTSIASAFTQRKVKAHLAMTGEITLRGRVLPVGGIKEKILAAKRAGIKEIILSADNKKDIAEIKKSYIKDLKFHYVEKMMDVVKLSLMKEKVKNPIQLN